MNAAHMCMGVGLSTTAWEPIEGHLSEKKRLSLSHPLPQSLLTPQVGMRRCEPLPNPCWNGDCLDHVQVLQAVTSAVSLCVQWPCHVQKTLIHSSLS